MEVCRIVSECSLSEVKEYHKIGCPTSFHIPFRSLFFPHFLPWISLFLSAAFSHQINPTSHPPVLFACYLNILACHLTTELLQLQLHVNYVIILQIMFLSLSSSWLRKLIIYQSENLKQFSKLGNQFIIPYYITHTHL